MTQTINIIFVAILQTLSWAYVSTKISNKKIKANFKNVMLLIILSICTFITITLNIGVIKILFLYSIITILFQNILKISLSNSAVINFISLILHCIVEVFMALTITLLNIENEIFQQYFQQTILSAAISFTLVILLTFFLKKLLIYIVNIIESESIKWPFIIIIVSILSILFFMNINMNIDSWKTKNFLLSILFVLSFIILIIFLILEEVKYHKSNKKFKYLFKNTQKISSLLEKYQKINHENKNDLRIIKELIDNKKNEKAISYISAILNEKNISENERWINELSKITDIGLRGFIILKINEMVDNNIKVMVNISNRLKKYNFDKMSSNEYKNICRIIGIYIDNAYEASKESVKKEVTIEIIYQNEISIIISNSFSGKIDLNKVDTCGYTTKGQEHGIGLAVVKDIVKLNNNIIKKTEIIDDYFYQYLYIKNK